MKLCNRTADAVEVSFYDEGGQLTATITVPPGTHSIPAGLTPNVLPLGLFEVPDNQSPSPSKATSSTKGVK